MVNNSKETIFKWVVYFIGLMIMSLGIVLTIKAELGVSSWDVLHIGLHDQFGLTIGSWTIITGAFVLLISTILMKSVPQLGAFINMIAIGIFIDLYLLLPFLHTPHSFLGQLLMLLIGIVVLCYGMGLYISAKCGAGPRDSLMMALVKKTGKSINVIRGSIEIIVLFIGWILGGPVFIGTIITTLSLGYMAGIMIPFCEKSTDKLFSKLFNQSGKLFEKVC